MKLLALETSTDTLSLGVQHGESVYFHSAPGGAQASSTLIAAIQSLMAQAGLQLSHLDAIVFGRGPGSFTGLRTACAVVQGLALGAQVRVLPIDTLLALAQEARLQLAPTPTNILAALDARMGQVYAAYYDFNSKLSNTEKGIVLKSPENILDSRHLPPSLLAGNLRPTMDALLPPSLLQVPYLPCLPSARALLSLAPGLIAAGGLRDAQEALPLYIRDKVALTTAERESPLSSTP